MKMFSKQAFDNRRAYITDFYLTGRENLEREYVYLTPEQADAFVEESCLCICEQLKEYLLSTKIESEKDIGI